MENLVNYLLVQAKQHKALVDSIPTLQKFSDLENQTLELQVSKTSLQNELEARRKELEALKVQSTVQKQVASSEALKAQEGASAILAEATAKAAKHVSEAHREADTIITDARLAKENYDGLIAKAKLERDSIHGEYINWAAKLREVRDELLNLKAKL